MLKPALISGGAVTLILGTLGTAAAQEQPGEAARPNPEGAYTADTATWDYGERGQVPAPSNAFELMLGTGYTQGFGDLQEGTSVNDTAEAGMGFELGLGYRFSPRWALGVSGGYQFYQEGDELVEDEMARGATARIDATYHFAPYSRIDPWAKLGTGYRYLCECDQPGDNAHLHGLELANLNLGFDVRVSKQFAFSPVIGGGLDVFFWDGTDEIDDPRASAFVFAGLQARFDLGGSYARPFPEMASR